MVLSFLITLLAVGFVMGLCALKGAEVRIKAARIFEGIILALFVVLFCVVLNRPLYKALSVFIDGKEVLSEPAADDLARINNLFSEYELQEGKAITEVNISLSKIQKDKVGRSKLDDGAFYYLKDFFGERIPITQEDVEEYHRMLKSKLLSLNENGDAVASGDDDDYETFKRDVQNRINGILENVNNPLKVMQMSSSTGYLSIQELCHDVPDFLTSLSTMHLPESDRSFKFTLAPSGDGSKWSVAKTTQLEYQYGPVDSSFVRNMEGIHSPLAVVIGLLVFLLMSFSYLIAYRSKKVLIDRKGKIGGDSLGGSLL